MQALDQGDLSIVGPLLGMKTLLVAIFSFSTGQAELTAWLWIASIAATAGVILIQRGPRRLTKRRRAAACYAFGASLLFALCDILVVEARGQLGIGWLSPTLFLTVALLVPLMGKHPKAPSEARKPMYLGSVIMGFQTYRILIISLTGQAVMVNIVYSPRIVDSCVDRYYGREGSPHFQVAVVVRHYSSQQSRLSFFSVNTIDHSIQLAGDKALFIKIDLGEAQLRIPAVMDSRFSAWSGDPPPLPPERYPIVTDTIDRKACVFVSASASSI